ncbi:hypothetical protein [Gordonia malaquae]|uniref:hypothetical protein n=1 Tax=Gordonia malaquae TaxID=410332 RepID=UPI0030FF2456
MIDFSGHPPLVAVGDLPEGVEATDDLIGTVCEAIRGWCGWHIAPSYSEKVVVDNVGNKVVHLPTMHLTDVEKVEDYDGHELSGIRFSQDGMLHREAGWPKGFQAISASVTHGLDSAPADVIAVVVDMIRDYSAAEEASASGPAPTDVRLDGAQIQFESYSVAGVRRRIATSYGQILNRYRL